MNQLKHKQDYIQWFLSFRLKRPKMARLLIKISRMPDLLERVFFVNDVSDKDNFIVVAARGTDAFPFICKIDGIYYSQPQEAYEALLELPDDEAVYVCLEYPERPLLPEKEQEEGLSASVDDQMVQNLQLIWLKLARREILHEIDAALDKKDADEFTRLTEKLRRIER